MRQILATTLRHAALPAGAVLIAAGVLKTHALALNGFGKSPLEAILIPILIVLELYLGASILLRRPSRLVIATTIFAFALFALSNLAAIVRAEPECPCFGNLRPTPLLTFSIDVLCILGLAASLRYCETSSLKSIPDRFIAFSRRLATVTATAAFCWALFSVVDSSSDVARYRHEALRFSSSSLNIGTTRSGVVVPVTLEVINKWREPVTVLSGSQNLSLSIRPGERKSVRLFIASPDKGGPFKVPVTMDTDLTWQRTVRAVVSGYAIAKAE